MDATSDTSRPNTGERAAAILLIDGVRGREGFVFHDGHNRPVHQAAPGLLGLLDGRQVIQRWKPQILTWLDGTEHFFNHLCAEFDGEPAFEPVRREIEDTLALDAPLPVRNQFLFQYLDTVTRELERSAVGRAATPPLHVATGDLVSLNGIWTAHYRLGEGVYVDREMTLPVNWELIPGIDSYAGTMRFTRTVTLADELRGRRLFLHLHGIDYFADLWVNGHYVGGHEGFFGPFELEITAFVRFDRENILRLTVASPNDPSGPGTHVTSGWHDFAPGSSFPNMKTLPKGTLGHHDAKRGGAWSSLTSQDGNTGGVWNDIELRVLNPVHLAAGGLRVTTLSASADERRAAVQVQVAIRNTTDRLVDATLRMRAEPANFDGQSHECSRTLVLRPGANDLTLVERMQPVELWFPRDHGLPHLYRITATVEVDGEPQDEASLETGFRTLAVSPIGESEGRDGAFVVNRSRVFVRGTNLLPTYWLSEYTPERIDRDFDMLAEAGFNAVLVHTLVLPRAFYEEADRRGFLVVQIFPLQWSYEQSNNFVTRALQQIREMTHLLVNHPSVVSYEAHNEPDMRTHEHLDNRVFDFDLHAAVRESDPFRWGTTFSSGNHAYPGQFYPYRDDNSFATLPARFLEHEFNGRRISRHRNMPTEFGIQAMPNVGLFRENLAEERVMRVLERIRTDPKWVASGAEGWQEAAKTIEEAKSVLGEGSWDETLDAFDWAVLWDIGGLVERVRTLQDAPQDDPSHSRELLANKLALLVLEVLHYGGFKGENFWFGLWRPAHTLEEFVRFGQERQYRLHKEAIEMYLNAGVVGPIVGYFSFMFRDADWQAPTWGVVDGSWVPKKAYRAYVESNHPVRVSLPSALRSPVKLPGDQWLPPVEVEGDTPWAKGPMIVANDTRGPLRGARVSVWVEDESGTPLGPTADVTLDLPAGRGVSHALPQSDWAVPAEIAPGTYYLKARIASAQGDVLSTNSYELLVPDTRFDELATLSEGAVRTLLDGAPGAAGFHYWQAGAVVHRADPGLRGFLQGYLKVKARGIDLYETVQGEHLFRHLLDELGHVPHAGWIVDELWRIRSEIMSPVEKARVLVRYLELFVEQAEQRLGHDQREES